MEPTDTDALDRADMAALAGGHDAALNALMDRHATMVFHFLYRMLGNEDDADELAQETFVRVFQHRAKFKMDAKFTTWLYTIAGNLARNHHRWRTRHPSVSLDAAAEDGVPGLGDTLPSANGSPSDQAIREERSRAVRAAVKALPEDMREAVILCEWQELSLVEAASVLNTTPKAVESRLYRARKLLREKLDKWL
jgi:RNA polymerase sigma-70 factor, ECF subfamily